MELTEKIKQGRFIQRDPLGTRDGICITEFSPTGNPTFPRKHNSKGQYKDGMSLYEYVRTSPIIGSDPTGLMWPTNSVPCCKKKTSDTNYCESRQRRTCCPKGWIAIPDKECGCKYNAFRIGKWAKENAGNTNLKEPIDGDQDAYRHCIWMCKLRQDKGWLCAAVVGDYKELRDWYKEFKTWTKNREKMDLHNNDVGLKIGGDCKKSCPDECMKKFKDGELLVIEDDELVPSGTIE